MNSSTCSARGSRYATNKLKETQLTDDEFDAAETIAANNVLDGLRLLNFIDKRTDTYPWGLKLPAAGSGRGNAIAAEIERIANINDAVADLALAESVHQVVKGNFDRAAGSLNAFSKGGIPPIPEVVKTPRRGIQLTHRFGLHLDPAAAGARRWHPQLRRTGRSRLDCRSAAASHEGRGQGKHSDRHQCAG